MNLSADLQSLLSCIPGLNLDNIRLTPVGGGSINQTYKLTTGNQNWFIKFNSSKNLHGLFTKEKNGLHFLQKQNSIRVPEVVDLKENDESQLLILEWINQKAPTAKSWQLFGKKLAELHWVTATHFGFEEDNFMGSLHQPNNYYAKWIDFFIENRLKPQVQLALTNHYLQPKQIELFEKLYQKIPIFFEDEKPSLLHGDLWNGNFLFDENVKPVIFDPAVYFGHRTMDLAMTKLFGGFDPLFYDTYNHYYPFPKNFNQQAIICNLYPLLIHLNLFGSGYFSQVNSILKIYC